ncbi:Com family DNA-binding transcriptional regulator [uncultured Desulfovibrio sp.]|uniref:Com family DNA-binding transcriptional regulator n=1 Tax=uncultured Desulfovibrio sp. TaxID=167968 RepID=UPI0026235EBD|nr:Com family DNA-binding transcriptional regulator [uncultured Desulfovibrio sp.]
MQKENDEIRCCHCRRLLAKGLVVRAEFKCPRCGAYTVVRAERPDREPQDGHPEQSRDGVSIW